MNQIPDMYCNDDDEDPTLASTSEQRIVLGQKGMLTEVEINGRKLTIVDPSLVQGIDRMVRSLQGKISVMEQEIRTLRSRLSVAEANLRSTSIELDNKVSYSRE